MARAQGSWLMGLFAGLLVGAIIWFAFTQWPLTPAAQASNATAKGTGQTAAGTGSSPFDRVACLQAAFNATTCFVRIQADAAGNGTQNKTANRAANGSTGPANGVTFNENATFQYLNRTYPCGCNSPAADERALPSITVEPESTTQSTPTVVPTNASLALPSNASWMYVLSGYEKTGLLQQIVDTPSNGLVLDAFQTAPDKPFSKDQVSAFKKNHRAVLAYLSIGEAEDYRPYWKPEWNVTKPAWMGRANPNWSGNVKVKYWDPQWQAIVFSYVDQEADQGFDGAYLDIVDAYEYWSDPLNGENEVLSKDDAAKRMVAFIADIRAHARIKNPDFLVFPQNAQELVDYPGYLDAVDGIGREDTWYAGYDDRNAPGSTATSQAPAALEEQLAPLIKIRQAGKTVLVIDYFAPAQMQEATAFADQARRLGFYPYPADTRKLDDISALRTAGQVTTQLITRPASGGTVGLETRKDAAVRITQGPGSDQNPAFLDGNTLVFTRFSTGYNQGPADLMQVDLSTGKETILLSNGAQNVNVNGNPFTPDRKSICYSSDMLDTDEVWCLNLASQIAKRITTHTEAAAFFEPSVSMDGTKIVFEVHPTTPANAPTQLWQTDLAGKYSVVLSDTADNRLPTFNPADNRILFQRKSGEFWHLNVRDENGTHEELPIQTQGGTDASWSGTQEMVYSSEGNGLIHPKIFSYNLTSGTGRQETTDPSVEDGAPAVSQDGKWLAFESHIAADENSPSRIWLKRRN